jgi:hypothetical protein
MLMSALLSMLPFLLKLYANSGYRGPKFQQELKRVCRQIDLKIVKRSDVGKFTDCSNYGIEGSLRPTKLLSDGLPCHASPPSGRIPMRVRCPSAPVSPSLQIR